MHARVSVQLVVQTAAHHARLRMCGAAIPRLVRFDACSFCIIVKSPHVECAARGTGILRWNYFIGVDLQAPYPITARDFDPVLSPHGRRSPSGGSAVTEWVAFEYWHGLARKDLTLLTRSSTYYLPRCRSDKDARVLGSSYVVVAPVEPTSGWTYLGEPDKIVTASSRRVFNIKPSQPRDAGGRSLANGVSSMSLELLAAPGEALRLLFLSPAALEDLRAAGVSSRSVDVFELSCRARKDQRQGTVDQVAVVVRCDGASCRCTGA